MSINKTILLGNLGQDVELRYSQSGIACGNFRMAMSDKWTDKEGNPQERTEWMGVAVFGKQAESCKKYLFKGSQCLVEGRLTTREWEDKEGNKRCTTEVTAAHVEFLGKKQEPQTQESW